MLSLNINLSAGCFNSGFPASISTNVETLMWKVNIPIVRCLYLHSGSHKEPFHSGYSRASCHLSHTKTFWGTRKPGMHIKGMLLWTLAFILSSDSAQLATYSLFLDRRVKTETRNPNWSDFVFWFWSLVAQSKSFRNENRKSTSQPWFQRVRVEEKLEARYAPFGFIN